jgi:5-methyltetrahydrofolate--homocysteine methyltransferase
MGDLLEQISKAIIEGHVKEIPDLTSQALSSGLSAKDILDRGLMPGMDVIGAEFRRGDKFLPEVLLSAHTMQASLDMLKPLLAKAGEKMMGKVVIGTVEGDVHDIGKSLVGMMLEGAGFEVIDLGRDVSPNKFVEAVSKEKPDIIAMSALLTTTMRSMDHTLIALKAAGLREMVKVMVGGAPVTADFAQQIAADFYASNAASAADLAIKIMHSN